jgi:hypothetical protein
MEKCFLMCYVFGNMPYMLFCGLLCLRSKGARRREGFHTTFEGERMKGTNQNRQRVKLK